MLAWSRANKAATGARNSRDRQAGVTLREAVEAVEGPFGVTNCIMADRICGQGSPCALHKAWETGQQAILDDLATQTLEDFLSQNPSGQLPPRT